MQFMYDSFLPNNQLISDRTANCRVHKTREKYVIILLHRGRAHDKKGNRKYSCKNNTAIDDDNNAFDFSYNLESVKCKEKIIACKLNLKLQLAGQSPIESLTDAPPKRKRDVWPCLRRAYAMSSNLPLNLRAGISRNQNNCPPNSSIINSHIHQDCARKI